MFKFPATSIALNGGDYTPGISFTFQRSDIYLAVYQPDRRARQGASEFALKNIGYTPSTGVKFLSREVFYFTAQDYTPSTVFTIPKAPQGSTGTTPDSINSGTLEATLEDSTGNFEGLLISNIGILSAQLDDSTGSFTGAYDPNVHRFTTCLTYATEQDTDRLDVKTPLVQKQSTKLDIEAHFNQDLTLNLSWKWAITQDQTVKLNNTLRSFEDTATPTNANKLHSIQSDLAKQPIKLCGTVDDAQPVSDRWTAPAQQLTKVRPERLTGKVDDASIAQHHYTYEFYTEGVPANAYIPGMHFHMLQLPPFDDGRIPEVPPVNPPFTFSSNYIPGVFSLSYWAVPGVPERPPASSQSPHITFDGVVVMASVRTDDQIGGVRNRFLAKRQSALRTKLKRCVPVDLARKPPKGKSIIVYPPPPPPPPPPGQETITIPTRTVYFMQHSITVTLEDLTPIGVKSVNLSLNADSYAWQFSAALVNVNDLPLVQSDTPVKLVVTINGYVWHVLVERIEHSRKFAEHSINLSGRGLTAYLSTPYYNPYSTTYNSLLSVAQIATMQLPPSGWTLDWQQVSWNVPSGAYSHINQTPMEALMWIARNCGAMLIPGRDSQIITIKPRYPCLPWQFSSATPDITIPDSVITALVQRPVVKSDINGVYIHGGDVGGVLSWCRLNSTAGDRLAPTESNNLMTDLVGARALGERTLAAHAIQPIIQSVTLPLDGVDIPLMELGQLAKVMLDGTPVYGIVNAISISAEFGRVSQTAQIGEETPNSWSLFKNLLPSDPLLVATLVSTDGKTSIMTMLDGGVVKVRGTGNINSKYYIRSGRIDGEAPNLSQSEIVI